MSSGKKVDIYGQDDFYDIQFSELKLEKMELKNKTFENCKFDKSNFSEATFTACKFEDCEFVSCNLSSIQIKNTSFREAVFVESKLIGINWTQVTWPFIKATSPVKFYRSNISHSSFYSLDLKEMIIEDCKAHDVDFREADLSNGSFFMTDFEGGLFMHTKLYAARFTQAINYSINPNENDIRKGKFSMPEVIELLRGFQIEIE